MLQGHVTQEPCGIIGRRSLLQQVTILPSFIAIGTVFVEDMMILSYNEFVMWFQKTMLLTLFRIGIFGAAHEWRGNENWHSHTLPKEDPKNIWITWHTAWVLLISAFFQEISKFCYIKKYRYRLYFGASFLILLIILLINSLISL